MLAGHREGNIKENNVRSSLNEMSTDQLGNRQVVRGSRHFSDHHQPFFRQVYGQIFKDDMNGFPPSGIFASWNSRYRTQQVYKDNGEAFITI
jgi:hypothetical protein